MRRLTLNTAIVLALALTFSACGGRTSPIGPSGYDPSKPIDNNNRPPGPGPSVHATAEYAVYLGDCASELSACTSQIYPTDNPSMVIGCNFSGRPRHDYRCETYVIKEWTMRTLKFCVTHPGVVGRQIRMSLDLTGPSGPEWPQWVQRDQLDFDEGDPARQGTVCLAVSANSGSSNKDGSVTFIESSQDLIDYSEQQELLVDLQFRVVSR